MGAVYFDQVMPSTHACSGGTYSEACENVGLFQVLWLPLVMVFSVVDCSNLFILVFLLRRLAFLLWLLLLCLLLIAP